MPVAVHRERTTTFTATSSRLSVLLASVSAGRLLAAAFVHVNVYLAGSAAVNAIGHHFGRRPYDNNAGNLQWLAFVTAGEGLHNNHHAKPTAAKLAHRWYEIDPGWWLIKTLTWMRLARLRVMTGAARRSAQMSSARAPAPAGSS